MGRINRVSVKRTLHYLHRNGFKNTCYAVCERLEQRKKKPYQWLPPDEEELARQRMPGSVSESACMISIVVPCYRTAEKYLLEMIESVRRQTYSCWELILADATEDDSVGKIARRQTDERIRYLPLSENLGIAENTNRGIEAAVGDYVGLLDHDDLLAPNALYEIVMAVEAGERRGVSPKLLYTDEDKCNGDLTEYYEPNYKEEFNLDLLLNNNYICHFMVMERKLLQSLLLRREYDGAQDYDLILRAAEKLWDEQDCIVHIPKVLYHWRCHDASTAQNPRSKLYAYDAGRRAVQAFAEEKNWKAQVKDTMHLGFYRLTYQADIFDVRKDVGAIGGPLVHRGRILSGRLKEDGTICYLGLRKHYSGYLHRAVLQQNADAVDIRNVRVREEARGLFEKITGVPWKALPGQEIFDVSVLPRGTDIVTLSLAFGRELRQAGYRILYLPECSRELSSVK